MATGAWRMRARSSRSGVARRLAAMNARRLAVLLDELGAAARRGSAPRCPGRPSRRTGRARAARPVPRRSCRPRRRLEPALVGQRLEHREDGALDQVGGRPRLGRGAQMPAAGACPRSRARRLARIARAGDEGCSGARRRRGARPRVELRVDAQDRRRLPTRAASTSGASSSLATFSSGMPLWRTPK